MTQVNHSDKFHCYPALEAPAATAGYRILFHPEEPTWLKVNETALRIALWLGDERMGEEAAAERFAALYRIPRETALRDVQEVARQLEAAGMLQRGTGTVEIPTLETVYLNLTERCNLVCKHCFRGEASPKDLPLDLVIRVVDELIALKGRNLILSGGEPLLWPHLMPMLRHLGNRLEVLFTTNGILITEAFAAFCAQELDAKFQISIEGPDAESHDGIRGTRSLERTLKGLKILQDAGLGDRIHFSTTITGQNRHLLKEVVELADRVGVPKVRFTRLRDEGYAHDTWATTGAGINQKTYDEVFDQFLEDPSRNNPNVEAQCGLSGFFLEPSLGDPKKKTWCDVGRMLLVETDGSIYPCAMMIKEEFRLGDATRAPLASAHHSSLMEVLYGNLQNRHHQGGCGSCTWHNFCQSGCMALAYRQTGRIDVPDSNCSYRTKAYARAFDRILEDPERDWNLPPAIRE